MGYLDHSTALLILGEDIPGAPWSFHKWKEITGIQQGIFAANPSDLPVGLSSEDSKDIASYAKALHAKPEQDRKTFSTTGQGKDAYVGRYKMRKFLGKNWKSWGINDLIDAAFRESGVHPIELMIEDNTNVFPSASGNIDAALGSIAAKLFGEEWVLASGRAKAEVRDACKNIAGTNWWRLQKKIKRDHSRLNSLEKAATSALKSLHNGRLTLKKLDNALKAIRNYYQLASIYATEDTIGRAKEMLEEAEAIVEMTKSDGLADANKIKISKVTRDMINQLAADEDVVMLQAIFNTYFSDFDAGDPVDVEPSTLADVFDQDIMDSCDLGVEIESQLSVKDIERNLGFLQGIPALFNCWRHHSGATVWDNKDLFKDAEKNLQLKPLRLKRHQLDAIHAILRMMFPHNASPNQGVLLADEVGLGKSAVIMGLIAVLAQILAGGHPPLVGKSKLYGKADLKQGPHIILVPATLVSQWDHELRIFYKRHSVDIFQYVGGVAKHEEFFATNGPWATSKMPESHRIIVASHSALQADCKLALRRERPKNSWDAPKLQDHNASINKTLFRLKPLTVTIDEAHMFRNPGQLYSGALVLRDLAQFILCATATPLHTSTRDVAQLGRILGIKAFMSSAQEALEKDDKASANKIKTNLRALTEESQEYSKKLLAGDLPNTLSDPGAELGLFLNNVVKREQKRYGGQLIRRTITSKDKNGNLIIELKPFVRIDALVKLRPHEKDLLQRVADDVASTVATENSKNNDFLTKKFYLEYRLSLCFGPAAKSIADLPTIRTKSDWETHKSSKFDTLVKIVTHLLQRDDAPDVVFSEDGVATFPPLPIVKQGDSAPGAARKILIYQEFPSLGGLLRSVFHVHGIKVMYLDGKVNPVKRQAIVEEFRQSQTRVLVFSSVGGTGLNLAFASVVILLDQPWSDQDSKQIIGRAWRQPQTEVVKVYRILALETTDIILSGVARGKENMLQGFLQKSGTPSMLGLLQGKTDAHCESDDDLKEDHADQTGRGQHPKPKSKRRNGAEAKNEEVEKNDPNTDEPLPPLKRKKTDIHTGPATEARLHNQAPGYDIPSQSTASELSFLSSPCAPPSNQLQQLASQKKSFHPAASHHDGDDMLADRSDSDSEMNILDFTSLGTRDAQPEQQPSSRSGSSGQAIQLSDEEDQEELEFRDVRDQLAQKKGKGKRR